MKDYFALHKPVHFVFPIDGDCLNQISALKTGNANLRQLRIEEFLYCLIVLVEILVQFVEPFLTLVVGSLESDDSERIDIANLVDIDGAVDAAAQCCIRTDDVGNLESGNIE